MLGEPGQFEVPNVADVSGGVAGVVDVFLRLLLI
jgi:hypothetical protein